MSCWRFNPARSGHGFDLQQLGGAMFVTWYTYRDDGTLRRVKYLPTR